MNVVKEMNLITRSLLFGAFCFVLIEGHTGLFACSHYKPWNVTYDDQQQSMLDFQNWLYKWQHDKDKCHTKGVHDPRSSMVYKGGMGSTLTSQPIKMFFMSFEKGQIFRPADGWLWAEKDNFKCTLYMHSLDCYFYDLSTCGLPDFESNLVTQTYNASYFERSTWIEQTDICSAGARAGKPMMWVYGQVIHYLMRYLPEIQVKINKRIEQSGMFPNIPLDIEPQISNSNGKSHGAEHSSDHKHNSTALSQPSINVMSAQANTSTIAVHYRAGNPDAHRHVVPLVEYFKAIDLKAAELAALGTPVRTVYFASQDHNNEFRSVEHLTELFPGRKFRYSILPISFQGDGTTEIEHVITSTNSLYANISMSALAVEYFSDVEIMVKSDVFIGSDSNMFINVWALRAARHPTRPTAHTCYVNIESELLCTNEEAGRKIIDRNLNGFSGGTTF